METTGPENTHGLLVSAYRDPQAGTLVVVAVNSGPSDVPVHARIPDSEQPIEFVPWLTSARSGDDLRRLDPVATDQTWIVPGPVRGNIREPLVAA